MTERKNYLVFSTFFNVFGEPGDGYSVYITPYLNRLAEDHNVFAFGVSYNRQEHNWNFGVENVKLEQIPSVLATLLHNMKLDGVIFALDINWILQLTEKVFQYKKDTKFIVISAIESDPLVAPIAMKLFNFDKFIAISKFGEEQTQLVGLDSVHLPAILDSEIFTQTTLQEKKEIKELMGLGEKQILFCNADLNERKNIGLIFESLPEILQKHPNTHTIILTRKTPLGWDLEELIMRFNLQNKVTVLDRKFTRREIRNYYAMSDLVLNPSKAGGLELAIVEAQLVGVPVIATDCAGMSENVRDGLGIPLIPNHRLLDIFMNQWRYLVSKNELVSKVNEALDNLKADPNYYLEMIKKARQKHEKNKIEELYPVFEKVLGAHNV